MKRFLYLVAGMLCCASWAQAQTTSLDTQFETAEAFALWTVVDANSDATTWQYNADATDGYYVMYQYSSSNAANDWLISPEITADKEGHMLITYQFKGSSYGEALNIYAGTGTDVATYTLLKSHIAVAEDYIAVVAKEVAAGETFRIAFQAASEPNKWRLYLKSVSTEYTQDLSTQVDLQVAAITSPVSDENLTNQEAVTVQVANNGLGASKPYAVAFEIDGTVVATEQVATPLAAGATVDYTFAAKADLSTPGKTYAIKAYTVYPEDITPANDTAMAVVRHKAPAIVPYFNGFEPTDNIADIKFFNLNEDDGTWDVVFNDFFTHFSRTDMGCLGYNYNKDNNADDWAILEPIAVEEGYYVLRFWYAASEDHPERLAVFYGNQATPEAMTHEIVRYDPATNERYEESVNIIHFDKAQTIYIGFYAFSDKDENWLVIDDVTFEKASSEKVDMILTDMPKPFDFVRATNTKEIVATVKNAGILDADVRVRLYIDDQKVDSVDLAMTAQMIREVTFPNVLDTLRPGTHTIKAEIVCDKDENPDNNSITREITVLGEPVALYQFENGKISEAFTMRHYDEATIHPDAGEEFNEEGWGLFPIQEHPMLGTRVLAACTWFVEEVKANRWLVLPKMKVGTEKAYFVWDAFSFNPLFLEDYQIRISDGPDDPDWYSSELTVTKESVTPKTRGIDLSENYAGKEIYLSIRVNTEAGEALLFDNIGLYGDVTGEFPAEEYTAVENIQGENSIYIQDDVIYTDYREATISLYSVQGQPVFSAQGQADISALPQGVYIARVYTDKGVSTHKIIRP